MAQKKDIHKGNGITATDGDVEAIRTNEQPPKNTDDTNQNIKQKSLPQSDVTLQMGDILNEDALYMKPEESINNANTVIETNGKEHQKPTKGKGGDYHGHNFHYHD